jgi:serine/threonine-protein kinase
MLTEEGFRDGIELFEESVSYEPDFAPAYARMAACYCLLSGHGLEVDRPAALMTKARAMAEHALRLNPDLPIARGALGMAKLKYEWDWDGAEAEFVRALELNPNEPTVHIWYAFLLSSQGRHEEALQHTEMARDLDPFSRVANLNVAWQLYEARRYEGALREFDATLELHPGSWIAHWGRGLVHSERGMNDAARADLRTAVERSERHPSALGGAGFVLARAGERALAKEVLDELAERSGTEYVPPSLAASIHAALGELDEAFERLELAYAQRSRSLVWLSVGHEFDPLRADPRYGDLLRRMGLEDRR